MKILIAFYSRTGNTEAAAGTMAEALRGSGNEVKVLRIKPKKEMKARQYDKNGKKVELATKSVDLKPYDLVLVGTPVWNFSPTPIVTAYLRNQRNVKGKKFALFTTCSALSGTTMLKMSNILSTKGAKVIGSLTIKSIFALDKEKLGEAREFAKRVLENKK